MILQKRVVIFVLDRFSLTFQSAALLLNHVPHPPPTTPSTLSPHIVQPLQLASGLTLQDGVGGQTRHTCICKQQLLPSAPPPSLKLHSVALSSTRVVVGSPRGCLFPRYGDASGSPQVEPELRRVSRRPVVLTA